MNIISRNLILFARIWALTTLLSQSGTAVAEAHFYQVVFTFPNVRPYDYSYNEAANSIELEIQKTSPAELEAINHYDERLIRRVLIKDLGGQGTELRLILRDRNVRATITDFNDPFRIVIDIYDRDYIQNKDPVTGLPGAISSSDTASHPSSTSIKDSTSDATNDALAPTHATSTPPNSAQTTASPSRGRPLLQSTTPVAGNASELATALDKTADNAGKAWSDYPIYVYRIQTSALTTAPTQSNNQINLKKDSETAMTSSTSMADYAARLFDIGQESRAMVAYQQVLHKDPQIFESDSAHLWRFAEIHFGQGNLTLAEGYFSTLQERHSNSPLARFAALRLIDIKAIRALNQGHYTDAVKLVDNLRAIQSKSPELNAQIAIRTAFWRTNSSVARGKGAELPQIQEDVHREITSTYPNLENQRTAFLAASLVIKDSIRPESTWTEVSGTFAAAYFQRFSGKGIESIREGLKVGLQNKLNTELQSRVQKSKYLDAIQMYEALPKSLQSIRKTPLTAWALGEAYRLVGQPETAIPFYEIAAAGSEGVDRFRAQFWLAVSAGESAAQLDATNANHTKASSLRQKSIAADRGLDKTWENLKENERRDIYVALKDPLEKTVNASAKLRTPPKIVLASWSAGLGSKADATSASAPNDWQKNFSPSAGSARLLTSLAKRFAELGMNPERRAALQLLRNIKPGNFGQDKEAQKLWSNQLLSLAEELRATNEYLEAGRIFAFVGAESQNWEGRAEALYKGGLLLYRAGRRDEALEAFRKAKADGSNLFYANLADERLNQIENR